MKAMKQKLKDQFEIQKTPKLGSNRLSRFMTGSFDQQILLQILQKNWKPQN